MLASSSCAQEETGRQLAKHDGQLTLARIFTSGLTAVAQSFTLEYMQKPMTAVTMPSTIFADS